MDNESEKKLEITQFEQLIEGLINNQYGCCNHFLDKDTVAGLRKNIQNLGALKNLKLAGLGKEQNFQKDQKIRGDKIKWIEKESEDQYDQMFLKKISSFIKHLNSTCYTSILNFESHYASYEQNSFYKRHLDQFKNDKGRKYSIIMYLNENWLEEDGGHLSLYPKDEKEMKISPMGGRLVFFKSDEMEHEVHPSITRDRISIAGWLKN